MIAKGKDASDLFPAVVKNVVSKNIEVSHLFYFVLSLSKRKMILSLLKKKKNLFFRLKNLCMYTS